MRVGFFYGSLMSGFGANATLTEAEATLVRRAIVEGYTLYADDAGDYPMAVPATGAHVEGELWRVPDDLWPRLDAYECVPTLYTRETVRTRDGEAAELYVWAGAAAGLVCVGPDWRTWVARGRRPRGRSAME
jgi:gamma-glutamylcyclotransferase (GGCT)/AIG2-like uncharacterized protein YtfP